MPRHRLFEVRASADGFTSWTLDRMSELAREDAAALRPLALELTRGLSPLQGASRLLEAVRAKVAYVDDPVLPDGTPVELVRSPLECLEEGEGDCDDQVTLLGSLALAAGWRCAAVACAAHVGAPFEHVFAELLLDGRRWPADPIVPGAPLGWWPAHARTMRREL